MSGPQNNVPTDDEPCGRHVPGSPHYLTLGINVAGQRCLVVGGGRIGTRKAFTLVAADADVTLLSPTISAELQDLVVAGRLWWQQASYDASLAYGFLLVVAATDDPALNLRIASDADARGTLCCNVSAAARSRVIFPAVYADDRVTVAVHSDGRTCRLSRDLRDRIAAWLLLERQREQRE